MSSYKDPEPAELEMPDLSRFKKPAIIVLAALVAVLAGVKIARMGHMPLDQISKTTTLEFPESAKLLHSDYGRSARGTRLIALVEMNRTDAEAFVASAVSQRTDRCSVSETDRLGLLNDLADGRRVPKWWNPDSARRFLAMSVDTPGQEGPATFCRVLASLGDGDKTEVYVHWGR